MFSTTRGNKYKLHWLDEHVYNFLHRINWNQRCFNLYVILLKIWAKGNTCAHLFALKWIGAADMIQISMHFVIRILQLDRTCRLDVFEEVHLPSTSFLQAILERIDRWRINIFLL